MDSKSITITNGGDHMSTSCFHQVYSRKCFDGYQQVFKHFSKELNCDMNFSIYIPPIALESQKVPVIYFLSGFATTEEDIVTRTGFQRYASELGVCIVGPDTAPRNVTIDYPEFEKHLIANFYVDVHKGPWSEHLKMYSYLRNEFIPSIENHFSFIEKDNRSIMGYSMGGHGAIMLSVKNPGMFRSCSALAPPYGIMKVKLGNKAYRAFFGDDDEEIKKWELDDLIMAYKGPDLHLRVDQGAGDKFIKNGDFKPYVLIDSCIKANFSIQFNLQEGYGHGWYFVSSFVGSHFRHHMQFLKKNLENKKQCQHHL
ncbi:S-formylglutathione hydrolase-like [Brevipalpus obovatus]|uniref:S-formylglutathione hydrolase-like n=1 Tax=Brevipalpus obovatus TaxID=246614 RepID=UPI003D9F1AB8